MLHINMQNQFPMLEEKYSLTEVLYSFTVEAALHFGTLH
jgi:hypothetical protein